MDDSGESFRALKEKKIVEFGECYPRRLLLKAWERKA